MIVLMTIQLLCSFAALAYIAYIFVKQRPERRTLLMTALISSFAGSSGYAAALLCETKEAALAADAFGVMGAAFSYYLIYSFYMGYSGAKKNIYVRMALLAANLLGAAAVITNGRSGLFCKSFETRANGGLFIPDPKYAIGGWILIIAAAAQAALIIAAAFCNRGNQSKRLLVICGAAVLPAVGRIASAAGVFGGFDISYALLTLCCIFTYILVCSSRFMDVSTLARNSVIETMNDVFLVVDAKMNIVDSNPAAKNLFPALFGPDAGSPENSEFLKKLIEDSENTELEIDGKCYEKHISPIMVKGTAVGCAMLALDITDTRRYVDELIEMRQRADMANNAKSDFLANMSHEIRTPMNAITGFAELCMRERDYKYAADIKAAAKNLIAIINDILDISKIESGKLELVQAVYDTENMLNEVISLVYVQLGGKNGVEFKIDIDQRLPRKMYGDEVRIKQILINLLGNAVKFTKVGQISLSVRELSRVGDNISLIFKVSDTGIGIKQEDISKLFSNFQQVDTKKNREIEGTGLGLSITKSLVDMMNGSVTVESEYGRGSVFTVIIQQKIQDAGLISVDAAKTAAPAEESSKTIYAPKAQVLVVDDNKVNLQVTSRILTTYGIKCSLADSGRKAIEMINSRYYDLVFMDHMMPELDGVDTTKIIRRQGDAYSRELPIIALTANAVSGAREMFLESGLNDFISKPIQLSQLEKVLAKWLPKKLVSYINPQNDTSYENSLELLGIIENEEGNSKKEEASEDTLIIQGVDVQAGLKLCGGNMNAYTAVLKTFTETAAESIVRIENSAQSRDYKNYTTEVHGLKSSSMAIGAKELSEMARLLEAAGREEDYRKIMSDTPPLIARYTEIVENIGSFLKPENDNETPDDSGKPLVNVSMMKTGLEEVLEAIDSLDSPEAIRILDALLEYSFPSAEIANEIENSRRQVDNFAYEKAEASVRRVLELIQGE